MDDARLVHRGKTFGNLARDRERASYRHLSLTFQQEARSAPWTYSIVRYFRPLTSPRS